jgi:hypothetical protein
MFARRRVPPNARSVSLSGSGGRVGPASAKRCTQHRWLGRDTPPGPGPIIQAPTARIRWQQSWRRAHCRPTFRRSQIETGPERVRVTCCCRSSRGLWASSRLRCRSRLQVSLARTWSWLSAAPSRMSASRSRVSVRQSRRRSARRLRSSGWSAAVAARLRPPAAARRSWVSASRSAWSLARCALAAARPVLGVASPCGQARPS